MLRRAQAERGAAMCAGARRGAVGRGVRSRVMRWLACLLLLTVFAGAIHGWLDLLAAQLYAPAGYIDAVLGAAQGGR